MLVTHLAQFTTPHLIVVAHVAHSHFLKHLVTVLHFLHEAVECLDDTVGIGDNGFLLARSLCKEILLQISIYAELHAFGIHKDKLQFRGTFLVEQRCDDGIQSHRFSFTGGTGNQQVRHLGQVGDKYLVAHRAAQAHGQLGTTLLEGFGTQHLAHGYHLRIAVGHLDTDGSLAGHGGDDADTQGCKAQGDVILQTANLVDAHAVLRHDFKQGDRGAHMHHDFLDFNAIFAQGVADALLVFVLLSLVHTVRIHADVLKQVKGGEVIVAVFTRRVVRVAHVVTCRDGLQAGSLAVFNAIIKAGFYPAGAHPGCG